MGQGDKKEMRKFIKVFRPISPVRLFVCKVNFSSKVEIHENYANFKLSGKEIGRCDEAVLLVIDLCIYYMQTRMKMKAKQQEAKVCIIAYQLLLTSAGGSA